MNSDELPLLNLFNRLRDHGLPLGVEEYTLALRALRAGFGVADRRALAQLCCTLWTKSDEEARLFHHFFEQMLAYPVVYQESPLSDSSLSSVETPVGPIQSQPSPGCWAKFIELLVRLKLFKQGWKRHASKFYDTIRGQTPAFNDATTSPSKKDVSIPSPSAVPPALLINLEGEPIQIVKAIRHHIVKDNFRIGRSHLSLPNDYFPVTQRQMKQSWRYLRRPVREGPPEELDLIATIDKAGREGILIEPVLVLLRSNRAELLLLIDQDGSMVPFHPLSRQLVETVQYGGRLRQVGVYYFHDYPDNQVYCDPARLKAQPISEMLTVTSERTAVLIVSDAGAARGNFDLERVERTRVFLEQLKQSVRYYAWLNPMPNHRWCDTTAEDIAHFVPMFELSRSGLDAAISVLQGQYVYWEKMYSWMI